MSDEWKFDEANARGQFEAMKALLTVRLEDLDAAKAAIGMLRDETDPVVAAAERLVQDSLGDERLWAALGPLREALDGVPTRLNDRGELWRRS